MSGIGEEVGILDHYPFRDNMFLSRMSPYELS